MATFDISLRDQSTWPNISLSDVVWWNQYINDIEGIDAAEFNGIGGGDVNKICGIEGT